MASFKLHLQSQLAWPSRAFISSLKAAYLTLLLHYCRWYSLVPFRLLKHFLICFITNHTVLYTFIFSTLRFCFSYVSINSAEINSSFSLGMGGGGWGYPATMWGFSAESISIISSFHSFLGEERDLIIKFIILVSNAQVLSKDSPINVLDSLQLGKRSRVLFRVVATQI